MRIADIVNDSVVDGLGIRMTVFVQGCPHNCKGCHNPLTHDFSGGRQVSVEKIFEAAKKNPLLSGLTFSGGEPFMQAAELAMLARLSHSAGLNIWCYSGFTLSELENTAKSDVGVRALLNEVDVLVDGRFIEEQKNLMLSFRGSENQRVIDMVKTRKEGKVVLLDV